MSEELVAWAKCLIVVLLGVVAAMLNRLLGRFEKHEDRITELEKKIPVLATKADVQALSEKVDDKVDTLTRELSAQHRQILQAILSSHGGPDAKP